MLSGIKNDIQTTFTLKPNILHVDDERDFLDLFQLMFSKLANITSVNSVSKALNLIKDVKYDLVITDYDMPQYNGLELLRELKRLYPNIPVIFYTGQGNEEVAREAFVLGAEDYFTKEMQNFAHKEKFKNSIKNAILKRQIQIEREQSENKFHHLFNNLNDAVFLFKLTKDVIPGQLIEVNQAVCDKSGYSREELLKMTPLDLDDAKDLEQARKLSKKILKEGKVVFEQVFKSKSGSKIPVEISTHLMRMNGENYILAVARDVSERLKSRKVIEESEKKFRLLYEEAPIPYQSLDQDGIILEVNNSWLQTLGYSKEQVIGKNFKDFNSPEYRDSFEARHKHFMADGEINKTVVELIKKDSSLITVEFEGRMSKDKEGNILQSHCIFKDITRQNNFEMRIKHLNRVLKAIRNVNQLIVKEKNSEKLITKACNLLIETRGYGSAWILLFDENKKYINCAQAAINENFSVLKEDFRKGNYPPCVCEALKTDEVITISCESHLCKNCHLIDSYHNRSKMLKQLRHNNIVYGVIVVSSVSFMAEDNEEKDLFYEVSEDIAYALNNIEMEKRESKKFKITSRSKEMLREIFENMSSGVAVYEAVDNGNDFVFMDYNKAGEQIDSITKEKLLGKKVTDVFPGVEKFGLLSVLRNVWNTGIPQHHPVNFYEDKRISGWRNNYVFKLSTGEIVAIYKDVTEKIINEKIIKENEKKYRELVQTVPYGIQELDTEGRIIFANDAYHKMYGFEPGELIGRFVYDFPVAPQKRKMLKKLFKNLAKKEIQPTPYFSTNIKKDKTEIDVQVDWNYKRNEQGKVTGYISIITDITEKKRAQKELKDSELKYRTIFENTGTAMVIIEEDGFISLVNAKFEDLSGYKRDELEGKNRLDIFCTKEDAERMKRRHYQRRKDQKSVPRQYESLFIDRNNNYKTVSINVDLIPGTGKSVISMLDITHLKQVENELRSSEETLHRILENMPVMLDAFDEKGNIIVWNSECEKVTGYTADEIINNPNAMEILYPDEEYRNDLLSDIDKDIHNFRNTEWDLTSKDGKRKTVAWSNISTLFPVPGWDTWAIGVDVTDRAKVERELINKNQELNDFAYRVSHDLKNPLTIAKGYLQAINEEPDLFEQLYPRIILNLEQLTEFINSILKLSRAGKIISDKKKIDIAIMIEKILLKFQKTDVQCDINISPGIPEITGDLKGIEAVFTNLLQNSINYRDINKEKPVIKISGEKKNQNVILRYKDNGIGVDNKKAARIFDPGYTIEKNKGTGFGLAIVRKIIWAHEGTISAKSEGKNKGTEFTITLPSS